MNQVTLIGRAGKDPEFKTVGVKSTSLASFTMATSEMVGKDNWVSTWHNIKCWSKTADYVADKLRKGDEVFVQGKLETESWEKDGVKQYKTVITAMIVRVTQFAQDKDNNSYTGREGCEF